MSKALVSGARTYVPRRRSLGMFGGPNGGIKFQPAVGALEYEKAKREKSS